MVTARDQRDTGLGDTRPRRADKGNPDDMERRYREQNDGRSTADYMDEEYEAGREAGRKEGGTPTPAAAPVGARFRAGGRVSIGAPLALEVLFISADELYNAHRFPLPSRLLVAFAVFGVLGMASGDAAGPADAIAWAIVVATFYSGASEKRGGGPPALKALDALGAFFGGKVGTGNRYAAAVNAPTEATVSGGGATYRKI